MTALAGCSARTGASLRALGHCSLAMLAFLPAAGRRALATSSLRTLSRRSLAALLVLAFAAATGRRALATLSALGHCALAALFILAFLPTGGRALATSSLRTLPALGHCTLAALFVLAFLPAASRRALATSLTRSALNIRTLRSLALLSFFALMLATALSQTAGSGAGLSALAFERFPGVQTFLAATASSLGSGRASPCASV